MNYPMLNDSLLNAFRSIQSSEERKGLFDSFLCSLKAPPEFGALLDSIQQAANVLLESDRDLRVYQKLSSEIMSGVVTKFQAEGKELTRKLLDVIQGRKGKVKADPIGGFGLVRSFEYNPDGIPAEADREAAKHVLISSVFPFILMRARELQRRANDFEVAHDFIVSAIEKLPSFLARFEYKGSSFLNAFQFELKNLERDGLAKANEIGTAERSWKKGTSIEKGKIIAYSGSNYRSLEAIPALENTRPPIEATNLWEPVGRSRKTSISLDQPLGDGEAQVRDTLESPYYTSRDAEGKGELARLHQYLPSGPEKSAIDYLYGITTGTPISDVAAAERLGIGRTAVHGLVKRGLDRIRSKAHIGMPLPTAT